MLLVVLDMNFDVNPILCKCPCSRGKFRQNLSELC